MIDKLLGKDYDEGNEKFYTIAFVLTCVIGFAAGVIVGMLIKPCPAPEEGIPAGVQVVMEDIDGCSQNLSMHCCIQFTDKENYTLGQIWECD